MKETEKYINELEEKYRLYTTSTTKEEKARNLDDVKNLLKEIISTQGYKNSVEEVHIKIFEDEIEKVSPTNLASVKSKVIGPYKDKKMEEIQSTARNAQTKGNKNN